MDSAHEPSAGLLMSSIMNTNGVMAIYSFRIKVCATLPGKECPL